MILWWFLECFFVFFFVFLCKCYNGKLCLDCTGVDGLHVRPSRGTSVFMFFYWFFDVFSQRRFLLTFHRFWAHFGRVLAPFWLHFGTILTSNRRHKKKQKKGVKKWNQGIPSESVSGGGGGLGVPKEQLKPTTTRTPPHMELARPAQKRGGGYITN